MSGYITVNAALITRMSKSYESGKDVFFLDGKYSDRIQVENAQITVNKSAEGFLFSLLRINGGDETKSKLFLILQNEIAKYYRKIDFSSVSGDKITAEIVEKIENVFVSDLTKGMKDATLESMSALTLSDGKAHAFSSADHCVLRMRNGDLQSLGADNVTIDYKAKDMFLVCDDQAISAISRTKLEDLILSYDNPEVIVDEITREIRLNGYEEELTVLLIKIEGVKASPPEERRARYVAAEPESKKYEDEDDEEDEEDEEEEERPRKRPNPPKRKSANASDDDAQKRTKENIVAYVASGLTIALLILIISVIFSNIVNNNDRQGNNQENQVSQGSETLGEASASPAETPEETPEPTPESAAQTPGGIDATLPTPDGGGNSLTVIDNDPTPVPTAGPTPTPAPTQPPANIVSETDEFIMYVVQRGDTLMEISREFYGDASGYLDIMRANGIENPNEIMSGQTIKIPKR